MKTGTTVVYQFVHRKPSGTLCGHDEYTSKAEALEELQRRRANESLMHPNQRIHWILFSKTTTIEKVKV